VERNVAHHEISNGREIPAGEQIEKLRALYAPSAQAVTRFPLEMFAAMTKFPAQDSFPNKQNNQQPLGLYDVNCTKLLGNALSSIFTEKQAPVFR